MSADCPTAAHACCIETSLGLCLIPSFAIPLAIAPEVTSTTAFPFFLNEATSPTILSIAFLSSEPSAPVSTFVPALTTKHLNFSGLNSISSPIFRAHFPCFPYACKRGFCKCGFHFHPFQHLEPLNS